MATAPETRRLKLRFGVFEMDSTAGELTRKGLRLKLQGQPFQLLQVFTARPGEVVTREELRAALWPDETFVDFDHGLNNAVQKLREVLGDSADSPRFIETIPRRGYRFLAQVEVLSQGPAGKLLPAKDIFQRQLAEIRQELLMTSSAPELKKLHLRTENFLELHPEHPSLHEARGLMHEIQHALEHALGEVGRSGASTTKATSISPETAACVFDDPNALSRYYGFGCWLTLGKVRGQAIVVDHSMEERKGREIIRIISARKATPAERRAYDKRS